MTPAAARRSWDVQQAAQQLFGDRLDHAEQFVARLREHGPTRGLIGPKEADRLWERHMLNCAQLSDLIPAQASVADIGTGAGFPGIVLAIRRPDLSIAVIESMARRVQWLRETIDELALRNVSLWHARAEELAGDLSAQVVTARAVAPLERLLGWAWPLCRPGGQVLAIKGERAESEVTQARAWLRRRDAGQVRIEELGPVGAPWATRVVVVPKRRRDS